MTGLAFPPIEYTTEHVCPGFDTDGRFNPDECQHWDDESGEQLIPFESVCRCVHDCGDPGEAGCCACNHSDIYEPCDVVGFGCGSNARPYMWRGDITRPDPAAHSCDCCTPEQWAAAAWLDRPFEATDA